METLQKKLKNLQVRNKNLKEKLDEEEKEKPEEKEGGDEPDRPEDEEEEEAGEEQAEEIEKSEEGAEEDKGTETVKPDDKNLPKLPTPPLTDKQLKSIIVDLSARLSKVESYLFRVI